ncbi:hypothetical protein ACOME3_002607 [Neoechinorhynchus agilis]
MLLASYVRYLITRSISTSSLAAKGPDSLLVTFCLGKKLKEGQNLLPQLRLSRRKDVPSICGKISTMKDLSFSLQILHYSVRRFTKGEYLPVSDEIYDRAINSWHLFSQNDADCSLWTEPVLIEELSYLPGLLINLITHDEWVHRCLKYWPGIEACVEIADVIARLPKEPLSIGFACSEINSGIDFQSIKTVIKDDGKLYGKKDNICLVDGRTREVLVVAKNCHDSNHLDLAVVDLSDVVRNETYGDDIVKLYSLEFNAVIPRIHVKANSASSAEYVAFLTRLLTDHTYKHILPFCCGLSRSLLNEIINIMRNETQIKESEKDPDYLDVEKPELFNDTMHLDHERLYKESINRFYVVETSTFFRNWYPDDNWGSEYALCNIELNIMAYDALKKSMELLNTFDDLIGRRSVSKNHSASNWIRHSVDLLSRVGFGPLPLHILTINELKRLVISHEEPKKRFYDFTLKNRTRKWLSRLIGIYFVKYLIFNLVRPFLNNNNNS